MALRLILKCESAPPIEDFDIVCLIFTIFVLEIVLTKIPQDTFLDPVLHQPIRTRIVAFLIARGDATFNELKQVLDITDGNLEAHMKKLKASGYIATDKQTGSGRPQTMYSVTKIGKSAFKDYVENLRNILNIEV